LAIGSYFVRREFPQGPAAASITCPNGCQRSDAIRMSVSSSHGFSLRLREVRSRQR